MNVLYTSQKLHELFCDDQFPISASDILDQVTSNSRSSAKDSLTSHARASGDGDGIPGRCCRLCGGDNNLRYFGDTYVWQGVEERYDQLLNDCFGVKVTSSDCMICECCVRALRTTGRFRALVHAAFDEQNSDLSSSLATIKSSGSVKKAVEFATTTTEKDPVATKPDLLKKREERKGLLGGDAKGKRTNIPCEICKQRYPMLIMNARDNSKAFICSRCKRNGNLKGTEACGKCNVVVPINQMAEHLQMHAKADLRTKFREFERKRAQMFKKALPVELPKPRSQKYQCSQCTKKYALARQLATHVRNAHGDTMDNICCVCNQDMESNEKLQEHLLQHSGLYQCEECLLIFKNKKILAAHVASKHPEVHTASLLRS